MTQDLPKGILFVEGEKNKPANLSLKILCQVLIPNWGTKLRYNLYFINHYCAKCCWWPNLLFCVAALYGIFPNKQCTWFVQNISGQQVERNHVLGALISCSSPGLWQRKPQDCAWVPSALCSRQPHHCTRSFAFSSLLCASITQVTCTVGGCTPYSALQKQSQNFLKHNQIVFSQITVSLKNKLLTENKLVFNISPQTTVWEQLQWRKLWKKRTRRTYWVGF